MLVLASASPARRRLLEQAAIPHRVRVSGVEEEAFVQADPRALVRQLAEAKAAAVAALGWPAEPDPAPEPCWLGVLGCDSLLVLDGQALGKPRDAGEAAARWRRMSGRWAELHTGHCLMAPPPGGPSVTGQEAPRLLAREVVTTRVQFAALDAAAIDAYVATGEPLQCAGGFALEGRGGALVERIDGCCSNVIGLSLPLLRRWLLGAGPFSDR